LVHFVAYLQQLVMIKLHLISCRLAISALNPWLIFLAELDTGIAKLGDHELNMIDTVWSSAAPSD
jgi:hypothetical protein